MTDDLAAAPQQIQEWVTRHGYTAADWRSVRPQADPQQNQALWMLANRSHLAGVTERAAVILIAEDTAPDLERLMGGAATSELTGEMVRCRACGHRWKVSPEQPYLNAMTKRDGVCAPCFAMAETRPVQTAPAPVEGKVVRRRKPGSEKTDGNDAAAASGSARRGSHRSTSGDEPAGNHPEPGSVETAPQDGPGERAVAGDGIRDAGGDEPAG